MRNPEIPFCAVSCSSSMPAAEDGRTYPTTMACLTDCSPEGKRPYYPWPPQLEVSEAQLAVERLKIASKRPTRAVL